MVGDLAPEEAARASVGQTMTLVNGGPLLRWKLWLLDHPLHRGFDVSCCSTSRKRLMRSGYSPVAHLTIVILRPRYGLMSTEFTPLPPELTARRPSCLGQSAGGRTAARSRPCTPSSPGRSVTDPAHWAGQVALSAAVETPLRSIGSTVP